MEEVVEVIGRMKGPHIITIQEKDGVFQIDMSHHFEVWKARKAAGLPVCASQTLTDHPLVGRRFVCFTTGKVYTVKIVTKHWYAGYYIDLLMEDDHQSSRVTHWESLGCYHPDILEAIREAHEEIKLMEEVEPAKENKLGEPSNEDVFNACMSYRHDFGLLDSNEQARVRDYALRWLHAWRKTLHTEG